MILSVQENGLAWLELGAQRGSAVPLSLGLLEQLSQQLAEVESLAAAGSVRLLIVSTARPHPNLTGYDLEELRPLDEAGIAHWSRSAQRVLRELEQLSIPTLAAIQGEWLGGAAELALACSYRVGSDSKGIRIGFPQIRLGLIPAWGGTVRLPRLVGLQSALQLVVTGQSMSMAEARDFRLVDRVLSADDFRLRVERYALRRLERGRPRARRRRPVRRRLLDDTAPGRRLLVARAGHRYLPEAGSNLAARAALDLIAETLTLPLDHGFAREAEVASGLMLSLDTRGRLHSQRFTDRAHLRLPAGTGDFEAAAVIGVDQTASDFAHLLASAGAHVRIKGQRGDLVRTGIDRALQRLTWEHEQGRISEEQARRRAARLEGSTGYGGFGTLNLVVATESDAEPVGEVLRDVESHVRESCLLAFHDWTTSPTSAQRGLTHPERVVGLTIGLPLERFPLLEIVPGALTSPETVATVKRLGHRLSLTTVLVSDQAPSPGTRLLSVYLAEGVRLMEEGATIEQVDDAATSIGFLLGPFHRIDAIGSDRVRRMLSALSGTIGDKLRSPSVLDPFADATRTFYRYRGGRPVRTNESTRLQADQFIDASTIQKRLMLRVVNEAARILEEGSVIDPGDLEVISIHGLGFPRERGGVLFHAQTVGITQILEDLSTAAELWGERFAPAQLLRALADDRKGFFGPESAHTIWTE